MVGDDTSKAAGWWEVKSTATTPGAITEPWTVADSTGTWPEVPAAKIIQATAAVKAALAAAEAEAAAAALAEAAAYGDVALQAEGYTGANAGLLGVFERQEGVVVQKRPVYKKQGEELFLFYSTNDSWMVGPDTSKAAGGWTVNSAARTPGSITETWEVSNAGDGWDKVPAATVVQRAVFEAHTRRTAAAYGDIALQAEGYTGRNADLLGVFELQEEVVRRGGGEVVSRFQLLDRSF